MKILWRRLVGIPTFRMSITPDLQRYQGRRTTIELNWRTRPPYYAPSSLVLPRMEMTNEIGMNGYSDGYDEYGDMRIEDVQDLQNDEYDAWGDLFDHVGADFLLEILHGLHQNIRYIFRHPAIQTYIQTPSELLDTNNRNRTWILRRNIKKTENVILPLLIIKI